MPWLVQTAALITGVGWGSITSVFGITAGTAGFAVLRIGASLLLSTAANALLASSQQRQSDLKRELSIPTEKPAYRYVYGHDLAVGSPAPIRVRGDYLVGCWILNSRPSALTNWSLYLDKRLVALTGDPFDFTNGGGATGTTFPFIGSDGTTEVCRIWLGRGDQTTVPYDIRAGYPWASGADEELFKTTDVWRGVTVMWAIFRAGGSDDRQERWPSTPPLVEVLADWSLVWDPRDGGQDEDDPTTWTYQDNQALIILDAARQNPIKPYQIDNLLISTFEDAADIADETVSLKGGGSEPRYTIAGTLVWQSAEMEDQLNPLFAAGAARPIRVGGRLGIAPGAWIEPDYTLADLLEGGFQMVTTQAGNLPTQLRTSYTSAARLFEDAELPPYDIPGAQEADGGIPSVMELDLRFAGSPTQAMRVQKIEGGRLRRQRRLNGTAPPTAFDLIGGSTMTAALAAPWDRWDGIYEIESIHPALDLMGEGGVALRCPFTAVLTDEDIFDWAPADDQIDIEDESFDGQIVGVAKPVFVSAVGGAGEITTTWDMPANGAFEAIEFWAADVDDRSEADLIQTKSAIAGATRAHSETGLGSSHTRWYWTRSKDAGERTSGFTASHSATTDP